MKIAGVDIGQSQDHTAIVWIDDKGGPPPFHVTAMRFPLGLTYPTIISRLVDIAKGVDWVMADNNGVGRPVIDSMREAGCENVYQVHTSFHARTRLSPGFISVTKLRVVDCARAVLRAGIIAGRGTDDLMQELRSFHYTKKGRLEAISGHDDMVMAFALGSLGVVLHSQMEVSWRSKCQLL